MQTRTLPFPSVGILLTLLIFAGLIPPAAAQPPAAAPPVGTFGETIDVRVVQVETVVTDADGNRIPGLGPEAFRLLVDGEEVPVEYFDEVREGRSLPATAVAEGEPVPERLPAGEEPVALRAGRSMLVFIDDYFTDRRVRGRLLKNLSENLAALEPGDKMAVVRFQGYGLEVLADWTDSQQKLRDVLEDTRKDTPSELDRSGAATASADPTFRVADPTLTARRQARQVRDVAQAMAVSMRVFAGAPGRKLFVPVTAGWDFDPLRRTGAGGASTAETTGGEGLPSAPPLGALEFDPLPTGADVLPRRSERAAVTGLQLLAPMIDTANLLGFSIYPMHVGRLGGSAASDEMERQGLFLLAQQTGGQIATEGGASPTPLVPVVEDTGSYYVLGFTPEWAFDNRRHVIRVEITDPRARDVRYRRNFADLSQQSKASMQAEAALLLGRGEGNLDVALGRWRKAGRGAVEVPVTLRIPMDWVTMVPAGEGEYEAKLELRVAALDDRGQRSEVPAVPINIVGPEPPPGSHATYEAAIQIRNAAQRLVLFLYDTLSGESRSASLDFVP